MTTMLTRPQQDRPAPAPLPAPTWTMQLSGADPHHLRDRRAARRPTVGDRRWAPYERQLILAVAGFYLIIALAISAMHFLQPDGQATETSSGSITHEDFRNEDLIKDGDREREAAATEGTR